MLSDFTDYNLCQMRECLHNGRTYRSSSRSSSFGLHSCRACTVAESAVGTLKNRCQTSATSTFSVWESARSPRKENWYRKQSRRFRVMMLHIPSSSPSAAMSSFASELAHVMAPDATSAVSTACSADNVDFNDVAIRDFCDVTLQW